jgi:hypothetical protein
MVESKPKSAQPFVNQIERLAARKAAEVGSGSAGVSIQTDDALNRYDRTWSVGIPRPRHTLCRFSWMPGTRPGKTIRPR